MNRFAKFLTFSALLCVLGDSSIAAPQRPNVIVILADDLGWTDLACFGSDLYETPHLDRLTRGGMRFTQITPPAPSARPRARR